MIDDYYEDKYGKYLTRSFFENQFDDIVVPEFEDEEKIKKFILERHSYFNADYKKIDDYIRQCFIEITYRLDNTNNLILYGNLPNFTFAQLKIEENIINIVKDKDTVKNKNHYEEIYKKIDNLSEKDEINKIFRSVIHKYQKFVINKQNKAFSKSNKDIINKINQEKSLEINEKVAEKIIKKNIKTLEKINKQNEYEIIMGKLIKINYNEDMGICDVKIDKVICEDNCITVESCTNLNKSNCNKNPNCNYNKNKDILQCEPKIEPIIEQLKNKQINCPPLTLEYIKNNELKQNIIDSQTAGYDMRNLFDDEEEYESYGGGFSDSKKCVDQEKCSLLDEDKCNSNNNCTWYKYSIINDIYEKLINKNIYLDEKIGLSNNKLTPKNKKNLIKSIIYRYIRCLSVQSKHIMFERYLFMEKYIKKKINWITSEYIDKVVKKELNRIITTLNDEIKSITDVYKHKYDNLKEKNVERLITLIIGSESREKILSKLFGNKRKKIILKKIEEENKEIDNEDKKNEDNVDIKILESKENNGETEYKINKKGKTYWVSKGKSIVYDKLINEFENQDGGGWFGKTKINLDECKKKKQIKRKNNFPQKFKLFVDKLNKVDMPEKVNEYISKNCKEYKKFIDNHDDDLLFTDNIPDIKIKTVNEKFKKGKDWGLRYCDLDSKGEIVIPIDYPEILFNEYLNDGKKIYKSKSYKYCFPFVEGESIDPKNDRRLIKQKIERYNCILRPGVQNWINIEYVLNIICNYINSVPKYLESQNMPGDICYEEFGTFPLKKYMNLCFNPLIDDTKNVHIARLRGGKGFTLNLTAIWLFISFILFLGFAAIATLLTGGTATFGLGAIYGTVAGTGLTTIISGAVGSTVVGGVATYKWVKHSYLTQCTGLMKLWMGWQYWLGDWWYGREGADQTNIRAQQITRQKSKEEQREEIREIELTQEGNRKIEEDEYDYKSGLEGGYKKTKKTKDRMNKKKTKKKKNKKTKKKKRKSRITKKTRKKRKMKTKNLNNHT